jgi:membrane associated rhomboid family serine protease
VSDQGPGIQDFAVEMPPDVDHCYRHPDRETGVHCSNCGRPICHECMTPAAVGFRCPECMAEQRRSGTRVITRQQTRSRWQGGAFGRGGLSVTKVLVGINVVMFLIELATGALAPTRHGTEQLVHLGALVPGLVTGAYVAPYGAGHHEYWRMVTVMFLHGGWLHILFNMWALWVLGEYVESVLGHVKFAVLYLVAGLAGSALIIVATPAYELTVGASGAIFGIFGALALYAYVNRNRDMVARSILGQIMILLVINLVFTFAQSGISWQGHIGGLVVGTALMGAYTMMGRKSPYGRFTGSDIAATIAALALVAGVTWWKVTTTVALALPWLGHLWR